MRFDNVGGVGDYSIRITKMATRLKELNVLVVDDFLVHHVLIS